MRTRDPTWDGAHDPTWDDARDPTWDGAHDPTWDGAYRPTGDAISRRKVVAGILNASVLRGLHKVRFEWAFLCLTHNLLKPFRRFPRRAQRPTALERVTALEPIAA